MSDVRLPLCVLLAALLGACGEAGPAPLAYEVAERDSLSLAAMDQLVYKIAVEADSTPGEEALRATAASVWERERGADWEEVAVLMYPPRADTASGAGQDVRGEPYATAFVGTDGVRELALNPDALAGTPWAAAAPDSL